MSQASVPVIAITGGPCGGKTIALSFLQERLTNLGFTVGIIAEAATEFVLSGLRPGLLSATEFQRQILKYIIEKEDCWKETIGLMNGEKKVIICDRGVADTAAYVSVQEFELILRDFKRSIVELRDERYNAVVFLRSVAFDAPDVYTCINNTARRESVQEARALDERTLAAWKGHPCLHIIDNSTGIEEKLNRVLQAVCGVLAQKS